MRKSHISAKEPVGLRELIAMGVGGMIGGALNLSKADMLEYHEYIREMEANGELARIAECPLYRRWPPLSYNE